jgi:hypothetical protein
MIAEFKHLPIGNPVETTAQHDRRLSKRIDAQYDDAVLSAILPECIPSKLTCQLARAIVIGLQRESTQSADLYLCGCFPPDWAKKSHKSMLIIIPPGCFI